MYECLLELEEYNGADGVCGFFSAPLDEYDEDETGDTEPVLVRDFATGPCR
jgi:hypothetical protein